MERSSGGGGGSGRGFLSLLYEGEECLGQMRVIPQDESDPSYIQHLFGAEIHVSGVSAASERGLHPLAVLHTISAMGTCVKMCPTEEQYLRTDAHVLLHGGGGVSRLDVLHAACLEDSKTAVAVLENGTELHLVAMGSSRPGTGGGSLGGLRRRAYFWGFLTSAGMYASCLGMLNLRCLAMVFDLDETLIVANTMRSFENRIEVLDRRVCGSSEIDALRRGQLVAELKRYQEDRLLLRQFVDSDQIFLEDNGSGGTVIEAQGEVVPPLASGALPLVRPIIRLPDRNMVLTRINPAVRDTSVLVRLRPGWEELRGYLIAKGRKRFEVFICTMAEREYALEMWRLLDPDFELINSRELMDRVVCVKSGNRKALADVFPHHCCHPNMAMVVDDRLKVWEESDQPRVHVVPAFAPYSAPQAEGTAGMVPPALRVARNVACNVRAGFFKHFDESLAQQMLDVQFESDVATLPAAPDVSACLTTAEVRNSFGQLQPVRGMSGGDPADELLRLPVVNLLGSSRPMALQQHHPTSSAATGAPAGAPAPANLTHLLSTGLLSQHSLNSEALSDSFSTHPRELLPPTQYHQRSSALLRSPPPTHVLPPSQHGPAACSQDPSMREEEGEVPESELDPDTRRRLLILQHGMDTNHTRELSNFDDHSLFQSGKLSAGMGGGGGSMASYNGLEEDASPGRSSRSSAVADQLVMKPDSPIYDPQHELQGPPGFIDGLFHSNHDSKGDGGGDGGGGGGLHDPRRRLAPDSSNSRFLSDDLPQQRSDGFSVEQQQRRPFLPPPEDDEPALSGRNLPGGPQQDLQLVHHHHGRQPPQHSQLQQQGPTNFVEVLEGIAQKLKANLEFKAILSSSSTRLLFKVEVTFAGQKVGEGTGSTKKEARLRAAESALWYLARQLNPSNYQPVHQQHYIVSGGVGLGAAPSVPNSFLRGAAMDDDDSVLSLPQGNSRDPGRLHPSSAGLGGGAASGGMDMDYIELATTSGQVNFVATLKEKCTVLGVNVNFQDLPTTGEAAKRFFHCQVEVGGQVLGKGSGISWDIAKQHAAEEALRHLKRPGLKPMDTTPRSPPMGAKRSRIGLPGSSPGRGRRGRGRGRSPPRRRPPGR